MDHLIILLNVSSTRIESSEEVLSESLLQILGLEQATQTIQRMLSEMKSCVECFLNQHKQGGEVNWFLEACKPPHKLCLGKSKSNGMMPAKIINSQNGRFEGKL